MTLFPTKDHPLNWSLVCDVLAWGVISLLLLGPLRAPAGTYKWCPSNRLALVCSHHG
ncbi:hypothetical protein [Dyella psychrodurans]|uniref:hypothetical protein n=1 Tax=Dyella psychrodurans TaxID=1927960 RepID=UPI00131430AB|nr:hypothetical protein [Dyella psychrodurans]